MSDIYSTPDAELETAADLPGSYPGLRRLPYFLYSVGLNIAYSVVVAMFAGLAAESLSVTGILLFVVVIAVSIYLLVKRLQNLGSNPWWAAAMFVPLLNIWIGLKTLAYPEGYDDHRTLDTAAKVIIALFVGAIVLSVGSVAYLANNL